MLVHCICAFEGVAGGVTTIFFFFLHVITINYRPATLNLAQTPMHQAAGDLLMSTDSLSTLSPPICIFFSSLFFSSLLLSLAHPFLILITYILPPPISQLYLSLLFGLYPTGKLRVGSTPAISGS